MKIVCQRSLILKAINDVLGVTNKDTLPILSNILLDGRASGLELVGTDLEVGIKTVLPDVVKEIGAITVSARKLSDIIRELPEAELQIVLDDNNNVIISCQNAQFCLNGIRKEEFPLFPEFSEAESFEISSEILTDIIKKTIFAVSKEESRYTLNGVLLNATAGSLTLVATDGHRLAVAGTTLEKVSSDDISIIIPIKALNELSKILSVEEKSSVRLMVEETQVIFKVGSTIIVSRLIEGPFPDYDRVIPKEVNQKITLSRDELTHVIRRVSLLANQKTCSIKFILKHDEMEIVAKNPEAGEAKELLKINYQGDFIKLGYNYRYLLDVLKCIKSENIIFEITQPLNPAVVRPESEIENYLYVIMPMKV